MANIGSIAVSLTAKIDKFRKGFKKAGKITARLGDKIGGVAKKVGALGAAFGAAAFAGLSVWTRNAMQSIDATAKMADVLGLTTEQLIGLQQAAKINGVELSQLNTGITRMLKNIGDAKFGLSTAVRSLDQLGLSAEELQGMETDETFKLIADRMRALPDATTKANVALNLFGRSGLGLLKVMESGAEGLTRFQEEAKRLGVSFNRIDAGKVEAANDAIARAQDVLQGVVNTLAIKLAPFIEATAVKFRELAMETDGFGDSVSNAFTKVTDWIKVGHTAVTRLKQGVAFLGGAASLAALDVVRAVDDMALTMMQAGGVASNVGSAIMESFRLVGVAGKSVWLNLKKAVQDFASSSIIQFARVLEQAASATSRLKGGISQSLQEAAFAIRNQFGGGNAELQREIAKTGEVFAKQAKKSGDAWGGVLDNLAKKGPLDDMVKTMEKRTDQITAHVKTLEKDNADFIRGLDSAIKDIESGANKAAAAAAGAGMGDTVGGSSDPAAMAKRREGSFRQISLSRFAVSSAAGVGSKSQKIEGPQLDRIIDILESIAGREGGLVL